MIIAICPQKHATFQESAEQDGDIEEPETTTGQPKTIQKVTRRVGNGMYEQAYGCVLLFIESLPYIFVYSCFCSDTKITLVTGKSENPKMRERVEFRTQFENALLNRHRRLTGVFYKIRRSGISHSTSGAERKAQERIAKVRKVLRC